VCDQIKVFVGRGLTGGFAWVNVVVFDTIGWSDHLDVFEARDGVHHGLLQFFGEAAGNAVGEYHIWELEPHYIQRIVQSLSGCWGPMLVWMSEPADTDRKHHHTLCRLGFLWQGNDVIAQVKQSSAECFAFSARKQD